MEKLNDLRFIIGLFFCLVGMLLSILALTVSSDKEFGRNLNLYAGIGMLLFAGGMLWLSHKRTD